MPLNTYIEVAVAAGTEHAVHEVAAHEVRNGTRGDALLTCAWGKGAQAHAHARTHARTHTHTHSHDRVGSSALP